MPIQRTVVRVGCLAGLALATGCRPDNQLNLTVATKPAVTQGDFDDLVSPFNRMKVDTDPYEGLISVATWDADYDPDGVAYKVETLFSGDQPQMDGYQAVFVASGTRGFGKQQYNGLDADDEFVGDEAVLENFRGYVRQPNHVIVVTDWAYDLVERAWPDQITWMGDDDELDSAQVGNIGDVTADLQEDTLKEALGGDTMAVKFDFSKWSMIQSVDDDNAVVWATGDVGYRIDDGQGDQTKSDVPLLVTLYPEGKDKGRVVFSSFHLDAQTPAETDQLITTVVAKFDSSKQTTVEPIQ